VKLNKACRQWLFGELRSKYRISHLLSILNTRSQAYGINRKYNSSHIYSSNRNLLDDIKGIAQKLEYVTTNIQSKYRYGVLNGYRFLIKKRSILLFCQDIGELTKRFPTCGLAHKSACLELVVKIKKRGWKKMSVGVTKHNILNLLRNPMAVRELSEWLVILVGSVREHLSQLQAASKVRRFGKLGRAVLWVAA